MARRKRRSWSDEEKRAICLQTHVRGVSVSQVARRYAMNANQIFNWLKDARFAPGDDRQNVHAAVADFLPVEICSDPTSHRLSPVLESATACQSDGRTHGRLEIELAGGHRISAEGGFDPDLLARLLKGLMV